MDTIVSMQEFFPWTWLLHLVRAIISFNVIHTLLKDKYNTFVTFLAIVLPSMLYSWVSLSLATRANEALVMATYYVFQFLLCYIVTEGKLFAKILATFLSFAAYLFGNIVFAFLSSLAFGWDVTIWLSTEVNLASFLIVTVMIFSGHFLFVFLLKLIQARAKKAFSYQAKLSVFFLYPLTHIFFVYLAFSPLRVYVPSQTQLFHEILPYYNVFFVIALLLCVVIDIFLIFIVDYIERIKEKSVLHEKELLKNNMDYQQMLMLKEEKQEFRKIKHDFVNITTTAKGLIEIGKPEKALSILEGANDDLLGIAGFSLCSNETINTIFYIKQQQAKADGLQLQAAISDTFAVLVDDYDLCRLLNNIIDNALNAARLSDGNKVCKIHIDIDESRIVIRSENGFSEKKPRRKSEAHGNGIGIIREIVAKYDGKYTARHDNDVWYTETVLKNQKPL